MRNNWRKFGHEAADILVGLFLSAKILTVMTCQCKLYNNRCQGPKNIVILIKEVTIAFLHFSNSKTSPIKGNTVKGIASIEDKDNVE